jgi:DNA-binding transcriptional LysR family regulator
MVNPNLKHLRIFVEIVRRGSFRNAALALHVSEPAASQAMTQLESLLGVQLLKRTTRSLGVTEAGADFLEDAERLLRGMDHAIANLRDFANSGRSKVSLACLSSAVYRLLPPVLTQMQLQHPRIHVVYQDNNMRGILQSLESGECDIALVSDHGAFKRGFAIPLVNDCFQVICPDGHPLSLHNQVTGENLQSHPMVLLHRGSGIRDVFSEAMEHQGLALNVVSETTQIHTLLGLVEYGLGVTVLPSMLCPDPSNLAFAVKQLIQPVVERQLGIVFPEGREPTPSARALAEVIRQAVLSDSLHMPPGVSRIAALLP